MHGPRKASLSGRARSGSARAPRVGAHALRVDAAMATRLRVAVVGQFSPPELIKINLDRAMRRASERRSSGRAGCGAKFSRACGAPIRYRNRGPAGHPPDFLYTVRNSVQNHL